MGKVFEQGIVVSIGNQKGGVGKSVITSLVANYIHQEWGKKLKIIVVDCDDLQGSLIKLRERDLLAQNGEDDRNYRLLQISSLDLPFSIEFLMEEYDIIFLDLPGNLKQPGVLKCYTWVDVLIVPTQTSSLDLQSTIDFANMYKNEIISEREKLNIKTAIYGLFSRVDVQNVDYKEYNSEKSREILPIEFLQNFVPESKVAFQRNVSTIETYTNNRYNNYEDLCEEILGKITSARG
jgi:cellulose biosynthesis protein BcsQ